jgi:hypothetical protein
MDEYVDFVETSLAAVNPIHAARQKALEERIKTAFRISGEPAPLSRVPRLS